MNPFRCFNCFNMVRDLAIGSIMLLFTATSAAALPGQSLETVKQWAEASNVLPPALAYDRDVNAFTGVRTIEDGLLALSVKVRFHDNIVVREQIVVQPNVPNLAFSRESPEGLKLIERIYDAQVAEDFRKSDYVAKVGNSDFYQGDRFVYIIEQLPRQVIQQFSVIPIADLRAAIDQAVFCQMNTCVVYQPFFLTRKQARR